MKYIKNEHSRIGNHLLKYGRITSPIKIKSRQHRTLKYQILLWSIWNEAICVSVLRMSWLPLISRPYFLKNRDNCKMNDWRQNRGQEAKRQIANFPDQLRWKSSSYMRNIPSNQLRARRTGGSKTSIILQSSGD